MSYSENTGQEYLCVCLEVSYYTPVRTLMAPCTALTSPLTSISISRVKSCGQASGQSQWAMADTAYATLERTLLIDSRRPPGSSSLMAALAWSRTAGVWQNVAQKHLQRSRWNFVQEDIWNIEQAKQLYLSWRIVYMICGFRRPEFLRLGTPVSLHILFQDHWC